MFSEFERAYVSTSVDQSGDEVLNINFYGEDTSLIQFKKKNHVVENPNYKHGSPVKRTIYTFELSETKLINHVTYVSENESETLMTTAILEKTAHGLSYTSIDAHGLTEINCELISK